MKSMIESAAKTASGQPVWILEKGQLLVNPHRFFISSAVPDQAQEHLNRLERRVEALESQRKRYL